MMRSEGQRQGWTDQLLASMQAERPRFQLPDLMNRLTLLSIDGDRNLSERSLERTIQQGGFIDQSAWTSGPTRLSGQVCRIEAKGRPVGTGFLVGPDLVLTAYNVVRITSAKTRMQHCSPADLTIQAIATHSIVTAALVSDWLVSAAPYSAADLEQGPTLPSPDELDYALIRLSSPVGLRPGRAGSQPRGWVDLGRQAPQMRHDDTLFILQHPQGTPLRVSAGKVLGTNGNGTRLRYDADTFAGSSGGPCVDVELNVVALHHAGYKTGSEIYNEGIPVGLIVAHLAAAGITLPETEADVGGATA